MLDAATSLGLLTDALGLNGAGSNGNAPRIATAQLYGRGSNARVLLGLTDGTQLEWDTVQSMMRPAAIVAEVAITAGVCPDLKPAQCAQIIALIRDVATTEVATREVDHATDWGHDYLQEATILDVELGDQTQRWHHFLTLSDRDPHRIAAAEGKSLARASFVLRDTHDSALIVRAGWFRDYVKSVVPRVPHTAIPGLMAQAGWRPPKRFKATNPNGVNTLQWSFYTVPDKWGNS